ncbi:MAG: FtsW/RodA/SpoVE family cell cycle protein [Gemmatimonadetes bacterium]|nr:FtsW/RodA/SpoVE family cell cycle protein [Gemmatimonadota bacterium]
MSVWNGLRRQRDNGGPEGVAIRVRPPKQKETASPADLRTGTAARPVGPRVPRPLAWGVMIAAAFYVLAHISIVTGVWPVHGTSPGAGAMLMRDAVALVAWLLLIPVLRVLGFRGNWAVVALPIIVFFLARPALFQVFSDPVYQATRTTRADANLLKAERAQLTTILRAYDADRQSAVFEGPPPALPDPWPVAASAERAAGAPLVRALSHFSVLLAPLMLLLGFLGTRKASTLRALREHKRWPFLLTLAVFFVLALFFTELGKVRGTTPWELFLPVFILTWAAVLADDSYNLARVQSFVAPRRVLGLLLYGALPVVPFLVIRELGLSIVLAGSMAVMLLVGTRRGWWAGLMLAVWAVLVVAAFSLDDRSSTRLTLAYDTYRDLSVMTTQQAERWAASVHQIKLFDANVLAGGVFGRGPGRGHGETAPNAADDGYITLLAAQYGWLGTLTVVLVYTLFLIQMIGVAVRERGAFERTLAIGLALLIAIPFWLATLGGLRVIPLTGVAAAFAAHGGAKLIAAALSVGVVAGISHRRAEEDRLMPEAQSAALPEQGVRVR